MRLCTGCGKRPARSAVMNMNYRGAHRQVYRKGHDLCAACWRDLRNKMRIQNEKVTVVCEPDVADDSSGSWFDQS